MTAVVLGGLRMRKLRAVLTGIAIVLGVAMISGTYVLMDTTLHAFNGIFATAYSKAEAVVVGRSPIGGVGVATPPVLASVVTRVRALPQVAAAQGFIDDRAQLRNSHGGAITGPGSPLAFGVPARGSVFNTLQVVAGHRPAGPNQIALDQQTATTIHLPLGSSVGIVSRHPLEYFRVVGLVRFGGVGTLGPIQLLVFDLPVAQRLFDKEGEYDQIYVAGRSGVSVKQLARAIARVLPAAAQVRTRGQEVQSQTNDVANAFAIVRYVLLAFAGIALFVGSFVIFNTMSVTVAQRTREFATLRTLGASRRQVLGSVLLEALAIGAVASLIGLVAGLGLAKGLEALFASLGMKLPSAGIVFAARTVIVSLAAGIVVTLLAASLPAVRATRVPPIAAVREGAILPPGPLARFRRPLLIAVTVIGAAVLGVGLFLGGMSTGTRLLLLAGGAAGLFVGLAYASRWLIEPMAMVIGRLFERQAGATGSLARENTSRNPARTAITAGALTIGIALMAFVALLAADLRTTVSDSIREQVRADYVVDDATGLLPPAVGETLARVPMISATAARQGLGTAYGTREQISGIDPANAARFYNFNWASGSGPGALTLLGTEGAIVSSDFATAHHLVVGSRFGLVTESGTRLELTVRGVHRVPIVGGLLGAVTISTPLFDRSFSQPEDAGVLVDTGGVSAAAKRSLTKLLAGFPTARIQTISAFINGAQASITTLLNLFYVLLGLSVIVSLFGIVNTLVLSIVERTREIGALRAMGMTRRQLKRMIRIESEITALIGGIIGIVVGVALAGVATVALSTWNLTFTIPGPTIGILLATAFLAGRAASRWPARRAAHLDPLTALQYE